MAAVEIKGRKCRKTATHYIYDTIWAGANHTDSMPKRGDVLSDPDFSHTNSAYCDQVQFDESSEPGRVMAFARFQAIITRAEAYV